MGNAINRRLILLIVVLFATGAFLHLEHLNESRTDSTKWPDLNKQLSNIPNWQRESAGRIDPMFVRSLKLDDFVNVGFKNDQSELFLYIGQYLSSKKVGAAHDPLVCFPGQGWKVGKRSSGEISVPVKKNDYTISYATMVAEKGDEKQLILYWFQAFESAYSNTFWQKIAVYWNTLAGQSQISAFVRVSMPLKNQSSATAKNSLLKFVKDFYPLYLNYMQSSSGQRTE